MSTYRAIFADPPWKVANGRMTGRRGFLESNRGSVQRKLAFPSMTIDEIKALPVGDLAHPDGAHLYLCTVNRYLEDAFAVVRAWGFRFSTCLPWCKTTMGGGLGGDAFGLSTEFILFARRGRCPALTKVARSWFDWKRHYERGAPRHSAKPHGLYDLVEKVSPGPRVELFARAPRLGWARWGNEIPNTPGTEVLDRSTGRAAAPLDGSAAPGPE